MRSGRALVVVALLGLSEAAAAGEPLFHRRLTELLQAGDYQRALAEAAAARDEARRKGDRGAEAWALDFAGNARFLLGDLEAAEEAFRAALALMREAGDEAGAASALKDLAIARKEVGAFDEAVALLSEARLAFRRLGDVRGEASAVENQGMAYVSLGLRKEALAAYEEALRLAREVRDPELEHGSLMRLGAFLGPLEGLPRFRRALDIVEETGRADLVPWTLLLMSEALDELGLTQEAEDARARLLATARRQGSRLVAAYALRDAGARQLGGDPEGARRTLEEALRLADGSGAGRASIHAGLARALAALGDLDGSVRSFEASTRELERVRQGLSLPEHRIGFLGRHEAVFRELVAALLERHERNPAGGDDKAAFAASERARARALLESVSAARDAGTGDELVGRVQSLLGGGAALVSYVLTPGRVTAFVVTAGSFRALRLGTSPELLAERVGLLADLLAQDGPFPREAAASLGRELVELVLRELPGLERLVIVPDGILGFLPFEALPAAGRSLVETLAVSYAPSAAVFCELSRRAPAAAAAEDLLLFAAPEAPPGAPSTSPFLARLRAEDGALLAPLPYAAYEGEVLSEFARGASAVRLGAEAQESALKGAAPGRFRVLHIAAHAFVSRRSPDAGALVLAPGGGDDGLVTMAEIRRLRLGCDTVVLSGCQTGGGELVDGEGVLSLARAFLVAGASTVVATLWRVSDDDSARLMTEMYRNLARGLPKAEALRRAKLGAIASGAPSRDWAAFVLIGDGAGRLPIRARGLSGRRIGGAAALALAAALGLYAASAVWPRYLR